MSIDDFVAGLQILAKHNRGHCVSAEHDAVYAGSVSETVRKYTKEELLELKRLGWTIDRGADGWRAFV